MVTFDRLDPAPTGGEGEVGGAVDECDYVASDYESVWEEGPVGDEI